MADEPSGHHEHHALPGTVKPTRFRPRLHWELLVCGARGHELVGTDAATIRPEDRLVAFEADGVRWHRCLRCDSWLPFRAPQAPERERMPDRDEIELPVRGGFVGRIEELLGSSQGTLHAAGAALAGYAVLEGVEAVGLWYQRRWAEYLTFIVTTSFIPLEVYELIHKFTPLKVFALVVNLAIVIYLLFAKRLFGLRGGAAADEAERERDVGWQALERSSPGAIAARGSA